MKKLIIQLFSLVMLALLASCPAPFSSFNARTPSGLAVLPADSAADYPRSASGEFLFEGLLPVGLILDIAIYDIGEDGGVLSEPLPPGSVEIGVTLTDPRGNLLYSGKAAPDGTISTTVYLPTAPENLKLRLQAAGFESREVMIRDMVRYRTIERSMAMKRFTPDLQSSVRSGVGFTDFDTKSVLNVPIVTIAFEDLFGKAQAGDADYNDFIASYNISETIDEDTGLVTKIEVEAEAIRKWAGYNHRFGIRIDSFEGPATLSGEYVDALGGTVSYVPQTVTMPAEIVLFELSGTAVGKSARFTLEFQKSQYTDADTAPPESVLLSRPPYNPYIYVHNTKADIHLIDGEPLTNSNNPNDRFVDSDGFPWALLVPSEWESPAETQRIEEAYPRFENWRLSGGTEHGDWYNYPGEPYVPPGDDPGARLAADIRTGSLGSSPGNLTAYGGGLYFSANDGTYGNELWRYDGTTVTRITDLQSGSANSDPSYLTVFNDNLYFVASYGGTYTGLFRYSGSGSPVRIANVDFPGYLTVSGGKLFFWAYDTDHGVELWSYDGTVAKRLTDINPGTANSYPSFITEFGGHLYFQANDGTSGTELWKFDGTSATLAAEIYSGSSGGLPSRLIVYDGNLYFRANDGLSGYELWRFNGTTAERVTDLNPGSGVGIQNGNMAVYNGSLYFAGTNGSGGWELYRYNGSSETLVADLNPGSGDGVPNPVHLAVYGGALYYSGNDGTTGFELWRYDGINMELAAEIVSGGSSNPSNLVPWDGKLYFQADDGILGAELWRFF